ncbi:hypothetical protein JL107_18780 [Nakamurella flavida]|uniref:TIGR03089 family protein n=1 Tax=Nakamurella flavida TaxID=363630 RepID=A0A939C4V5_9ACTN|nr:TIGR03089 family protein [Nakamurella flavida]MBM9478501.1 hypothetical protein [Nakamurella flavida]MDP9777673.1 uncharacterized protein (TIGR03089 family) [Nakamurella flavida]
MTHPGTPPGSAGSVTVALLGPLLALDPHRPRVTSYTLAGGRTELSTASLANWAAKVAGLLVDELGLPVGARVVVRTGERWQTAPILLGAWWAGMTVTEYEDPDLDGGPEESVAFLRAGEDSGCDEVFLVSDDPLGEPATGLEAHQRDFTTAVLPQADHFVPRGLPRGDDAPAVLLAGGGSVGVREILERAGAAAERLGVGGRLLSGTPWTLPDGVVDTLLAALAADGSVIQVPAGPEVEADWTARIATGEKAAATTGIDVAGLPRLD